MSRIDEQEQLAREIDAHVRRVEASDRSDEALLASAYEVLGSFKQLVDLSSAEELNKLSDKFLGLHRFASLLERIAMGIRSGAIEPPTSH